MTEVSILMPLYNVRDFIQRCLNSVAAQTYQGPIECIIVDDCGTDDSISIAKDFISQYDGPIEFRIISHDHNRGLAAARNTAVAAARGEFLIHLDSDDWLEPACISALVAKQMVSGADIVSGAALQHTNDGDTLLTEPEYATPMDMVRNAIELTLDHVIWRRLIRKSLYADNHIEAHEGVNIGEDHHTLPRLAFYAKSVAKTDEVVYHYNCLNPNSYMSARTQRFNLKRYHNNLESIEILTDFFREKDGPVCKRLKKIRSTYQRNCLFDCCLMPDRTAYEVIMNENKMSLPYPLMKVMAYCNSVKSALYRMIRGCRLT